MRKLLETRLQDHQENNINVIDQIILALNKLDEKIDNAPRNAKELAQAEKLNMSNQLSAALFAPRLLLFSVPSSSISFSSKDF